MDNELVPFLESDELDLERMAKPASFLCQLNILEEKQFVIPNDDYKTKKLTLSNFVQ